MTKEIRTAIKDAYRPLKTAYQLKGTTFSIEFDRAKKLANCRMDGLVDTMRDSAFGLWKLGLLPEDELNKIRKCSDNLQKFVGVAVEHFRNIEKATDSEAFYGHEYDHIKENHGYSEAEFIELFGTREEYIKGMLEDAFDDLDVDLKAMFSYFNLIK